MKVGGGTSSQFKEYLTQKDLKRSGNERKRFPNTIKERGKKNLCKYTLKRASSVLARGGGQRNRSLTEIDNPKEHIHSQSCQ